MDLFLSTKNTILKKYDGMFKVRVDAESSFGEHLILFCYEAASLLKSAHRLITLILHTTASHQGCRFRRAMRADS